MGPICRTCAKELLNCEDALKIFSAKHRKLLFQLQDLTGMMLKNCDLPKLMCASCHQSLSQAHQFRQKVLMVQDSFDKNKASKCRFKRNWNKNVEDTEFVQLCVKEEKDELEESEKEMNDSLQITYKEEITCNKKFIASEVNALELNEENILEDIKISILQDTCDDSDVGVWSKSVPADDKRSFTSTTEDEKSFKSDVEHKPTAVIEKRITKKRANRRSFSKSRQNMRDTSEKKSKESIKKESKSFVRNKKEASDHSNLFICDQCGNHFTCRNHFKLHLRRHTGDKQCACELCPDKFFTSSELRRHMRKHTGERPFACKYCERRFTDYSTRVKHERTHTNERPFICSQCGKSFTTSYVLKNHMLTHTGERHFNHTLRFEVWVAIPDHPLGKLDCFAK
ncbi:histone-lysine N-methyltransferase PRDM9 isoform X2 [Stomoxys calcitrans]|uniref:Protein krueppel n=1 Tax=Stomoxys calcitrans TaxID=35570 RepID=A0A1I8NU03_STOCA|nr:histone-lysine N-methyltransferase PRDM9 isoform X2 [Stomoxys calcitrans]